MVNNAVRKYIPIIAFILGVCVIVALRIEQLVLYPQWTEAQALSNRWLFYAVVVAMIAFGFVERSKIE
jgi:hypothetical protein